MHAWYWSDVQRVQDVAHSAAAQRAWQHLWPRFTDSLSAALASVTTGVQAARDRIETQAMAHARARRELSDAAASLNDADTARRAALSEAADAKVCRHRTRFRSCPASRDLQAWLHAALSQGR